MSHSPPLWWSSLPIGNMVARLAGQRPKRSARMEKRTQDGALIAKLPTASHYSGRYREAVA